MLRRSDRVHLQVESGLSAGITRLFSLAAGMAVANIYYNQSLLADIARTFSATTSATSLLVTLTLAGYAIGLFLLVPLADRINTRRLLVTMLLGVAVLNVGSALAPTLSMLVAFSFLSATLSVGAPILVAFASMLSLPEGRGKVTGRMMSGVLVGVLLARTVGASVTTITGSWRWMYVFAAGGALVLAVALHQRVPDVEHLSGQPERSYLGLLRSTGRNLLDRPVLQVKCILGFVVFAGFSALWSSLTWRLSASPYHFGVNAIGLVGLLGVAGALSARFVGPQVDAGRSRAVFVVLILTTALSWTLLSINNGTTLVTVLVGIVLLDLSAQGMQVCNLAGIYQAGTAERGRTTTAYACTYFLGGATGAQAAQFAYITGGWTAVCLVGLVLSAILGAIWLVEPRLTTQESTAIGAASDNVGP